MLIVGKNVTPELSAGAFYANLHLAINHILSFFAGTFSSDLHSQAQNAFNEAWSIPSSGLHFSLLGFWAHRGLVAL